MDDDNTTPPLPGTFPDLPTSPPEPQRVRPPVWPVFVVYVGAIGTMFLFSIIALLLVKLLLPNVSLAKAAIGVPGILVGIVATSTVSLVAALLLAGPPFRVTLRLVPGRQSAPSLAIIVLGALAISQALDSAASLAGIESKAIGALRKPSPPRRFRLCSPGY